MSRVLIDSNIFVYAFDPSDPVKHQKALRLIEDVLDKDDLVLSTQVLNELAWTLLRRRPGMGAQDVLEIIEDIVQNARIVPVTPDLTLKALRSALQHALSFWDGLIWAAACLHNVSILYTEDFQHDRQLEGVRFLNPFIA